MIEKIRVECPDCGGTGEQGHNHDGVDEMVICPTCGGLGQVWDYPEEPEFDKYEDD